MCNHYFDSHVGTVRYFLIIITCCAFRRSVSFEKQQQLLLLLRVARRIFPNSLASALKSRRCLTVLPFYYYSLIILPSAFRTRPNRYDVLVSAVRRDDIEVDIREWIVYFFRSGYNLNDALKTVGKSS